jgi:hypothetical protein
MAAAMGVSTLQNSITELANVNACGVSGLKSQASKNLGQRCRLGRSRAQVPAARETAAGMAGSATSFTGAGSAGHG